MSDYELYCGDCLDILPTLAPQSVDAVICDPPYGTTACKWDSVIPFEPMWREIKRVLKPRGACVLFGSQPFTSALVMSNVKWFRYSLVWEKSKPTGFLDVNRQPLDSHEDIIIFSDGRTTYNPQKWKIGPIFIDRRTAHTRQTDTDIYHNCTAQSKRTDDGTRFPLSIIPIASEWQRGMHSTRKPIDLLEYLVKTYTNAGDCVLDFTMGSGTTGHACGNLGRRFIGIERDKAYFDLASERIATAYAPLRMMESAS